MFKFDLNAKTPFVVISDKPAPKAILHVFSLFYQQPDPNLQLCIHNKKYASIARAFALLLNDFEEDFDSKFSDPQIQKQLKEIGFKEQYRTRENMKSWINSVKDDATAMNRAFLANEILFKKDCGVLLAVLIRHYVAANLHESLNLAALLTATQDTCIVYDNMDSNLGLDIKLANLLGCVSYKSGDAVVPGQNLLGLTWMQERHRLAYETPTLDVCKTLYAEFQAKHTALNTKGKSILTLQLIEVLPNADFEKTAPYIAYLVATAEAPLGASKSEVALYNKRNAFLYGWIANQTKLEALKVQFKSTQGYSLTKHETLSDGLTRSAPVFEGDEDEQNVVSRKIIRGSLLETLESMKDLRLGNHLCVFQTIHCDEEGLQLPRNNPLFYASDYAITLTQFNDDMRSDIQVIVSKVTVMRDHKLASLAEKDYYVIDVVTAVCPSNVNCSVDDLLNNQYRAVRQRYESESPSHDRVMRRAKDHGSIHIVIADAGVANEIIKKDSSIKDPEGRLATTHNNALRNAMSYMKELQSVTVLVGSEKLETSFNSISQSSEKRNKDYAEPAPEKVVFVTSLKDEGQVCDVISVLGYPGREGLKLNDKPSFRVFRNEKDDALFFCFSRVDIANEYAARLVREHGFDENCVEKRNSLSLTLPFTRPKNSESLCNSHPFTIRLKISSNQFRELAETMEHNREFWRPFTQKLLALFAIQEQVQRLQNEKMMFETGATKNERTNCAEAVKEVLQSLFELKASIYAKTLMHHPAKLAGESQEPGDLAKCIASNRANFAYFYLDPDQGTLSPNSKKPPSGYDKICKELSSILIEMTTILRKMEQNVELERSYESAAEFNHFGF